MLQRAGTLALAACLFAGSAGRQAGPPAPPRAAAIPPSWLQGYASAVAGEAITYPWAYPGQARALLSRATDGSMRVAWRGSPAPAGDPEDRVVYLWHAGLASGYGAHRFTLRVNGRDCATFSSGRDTTDTSWTVEGANLCTLSFVTTRIGTFNELFGFMTAALPRAAVGVGAPTFEVTGEAAGSRDYYMTFEEPVREWVRVREEEARYADGSRVVRLETSRAGPAVPARLFRGREAIWSGEARQGYTSVLAAAGSAEGALHLAAEIDGRPALVGDLPAKAVRPWSIHLLPHSHVDIGYSDPQPVVEQKQWKNLRDAVRLARETASYPPSARFRWNVEGLWSVESYLRQAPAAERQAFIEAVAAGSIGLQANYTNILTGLATPEELTHWTDAARRLHVEYALPIARSAMHTDIPGLSWPVVSALARAGVRYFSSGPNYMPGLPDGGDRIGRTLRATGDFPFWWLSPSGEERILYWTAGRGYSWFHGLNAGKIGEAGREMLLDYLRELAARAYPYEMVQVRYTVGGDNGPVDPDLPAFVKSWNERFSSPRLVIDTADSMFREFERRYGASLPTRSGDLTPYWEDGALSSAAEEAMVRAAARRIQQAETLGVLRPTRQPDAAGVAEAWRNVLLWHEHTWGAADSVSDPDRTDVVEQWKYKRQFALEADRRSRGLLPPEAGPSDLSIDVVNTLSWPHTGLVLLPAMKEGRGDRAVDRRGAPLPSQRLADGRLAVLVRDVPALGGLRIARVPGSPAAPAGPVARADGLTLENGRVRIVIDPVSGAIAGFRWASAPGRELAGPGGLARYLYVPGRDPSAAKPAGRPEIVIEEPGPLVVTARVTGSAPGVRELTRRITLVAGADEAWVEVAFDKLPVREKESVHLAFPFALERPTIRVDQGEAVVAIERDQLPGSCKDFIGTHSAVDLSGEAVGVTVVTLDAPLVEIGAITDERSVNGEPRAWREHAAANPVVYAYLLNNYWHTNYKADQPGPVVFRFGLRPHAGFDAVALRRSSAGYEQPLLALPAVQAQPVPGPPLGIQSKGVVLSSLRAEAEGVVLRLYNPSDRATTARIAARDGRRMERARGEAWEPLPSGKVRLLPGGTILLRIPSADGRDVKR